MLDKLWHPLTDFVTEEEIKQAEIITYYYQGICPQTRINLKLPRTVLVEKIALNLVNKLHQEKFYTAKGKMLGILIVEDDNKLGIIKAFSGLLNGKKEVNGWVKPIDSNSVIALAEKLTIKELDTIKQEIIELENLVIREEYQEVICYFEKEKENLKIRHSQRKVERDNQRKVLINNFQEEELKQKLSDLQQESRRDDWEKRTLKYRWLEKLKPLEEKINLANLKIQQLKQKRKELSKQLQAQMQTAYTITNFMGNSLSIGKLLDKAFIATGTGDCCAPKLLHHAAINHLKPIAMAEFWWGETSPNGEKIEGKFYPACVERCQPLMGFLLSGMPKVKPIDIEKSMPIIYEDNYLLVVNKPSGMLSVSGRGSDNFDSVVSRFRDIATYKSNFQPTTVHRLDQDTSGILILAKTKESYIHLNGQFAQRKVKKVYIAVLDGLISETQGVIDLPLWSNPAIRPCQEVNYEYGKASLTYFRVIGNENGETRLELKPVTGRTHQLRVHCCEGLGIAIKGDKFYGSSKDNDIRLHLHAQEVTFCHPQDNRVIHLITQIPF